MPGPSSPNNQTGKHASSKLAKSAHAEAHARDANMKLQLQLTRQLLRSNRDSQAGVREAERQERDLLLDLARILDSKLSPSIDQWFERRRVVQTSRLPDTRTADQMLARLAKSSSLSSQTSRRGSFSGGGGGGANQNSEIAALPAGSTDTADKRQRILEAKSADWFGFTSVSFGHRLLLQQRRPQTAFATLDRKEGQQQDGDETDAEIREEGSRAAEERVRRRRAATASSNSTSRSTGSRQAFKHAQKSRSKSARISSH